MWLIAWKAVTGFFGKSLNTAIIAVLATGVVGWFAHDNVVEKYQLQIDSANASKMLVERDNLTYQIRIDELTNAARNSEAAVLSLNSQLTSITNRHTRLRKRLDISSSEDDGPLAPVLVDTLRALRDESL